MGIALQSGCCLEADWPFVCLWEVVNDCFCKCFSLFSLLGIQSLSKSLSSPTFTFPILYPIPWQAGVCWELSEWLYVCLISAPGKPTTLICISLCVNFVILSSHIKIKLIHKIIAQWKQQNTIWKINWSKYS